MISKRMSSGRLGVSGCNLASGTLTTAPSPLTSKNPSAVYISADTEPSPNPPPSPCSGTVAANLINFISNVTAHRLLNIDTYKAPQTESFSWSVPANICDARPTTRSRPYTRWYSPPGTAICRHLNSLRLAARFPLRAGRGSEAECYGRQRVPSIRPYYSLIADAGLAGHICGSLRRFELGLPHPLVGEIDSCLSQMFTRPSFPYAETISGHVQDQALWL